MATNERFPHDFSDGFPEVSPELIRAYKAQPHIFEEEFARLKAEQEAIALELVTGAMDAEARDLKIKRAFAEGALFMFGILRAAAQAEQLRLLFNTTDDDGGGGDQQP